MRHHVNIMPSYLVWQWWPLYAYLTQVSANLTNSLCVVEIMFAPSSCPSIHTPVIATLAYLASWLLDMLPGLLLGHPPLASLLSHTVCQFTCYSPILHLCDSPSATLSSRLYIQSLYLLYLVRLELVDLYTCLHISLPPLWEWSSAHWAFVPCVLRHKLESTLHLALIIYPHPLRTAGHLLGWAPSYLTIATRSTSKDHSKPRPTTPTTPKGTSTYTIPDSPTDLMQPQAHHYASGDWRHWFREHKQFIYYGCNPETGTNLYVKWLYTFYEWSWVAASLQWQICRSWIFLKKISFLGNFQCLLSGASIYEKFDAWTPPALYGLLLQIGKHF